MSKSLEGAVCGVALALSLTACGGSQGESAEVQPQSTRIVEPTQQVALGRIAVIDEQKRYKGVHWSATGEIYADHATVSLAANGHRFDEVAITCAGDQPGINDKLPLGRITVHFNKETAHNVCRTNKFTQQGVEALQSPVTTLNVGKNFGTQKIGHMLGSLRHDIQN